MGWIMSVRGGGGLVNDQVLQRMAFTLLSLCRRFSLPGYQASAHLQK